ncbi:transcriptional regulator, LytTR family-like protein [Ramlibacter tataouinensis TTB310]|uniref:Transcriptional regulator, LytTR family-like protein n=1 Tax=Ramlibacter tataouinensis (strain ATCC BAA-407 / DSM 14655 / LMG 21543 / TTB310) TaxID=365046 RepID=F5Y3D3_RAMTT|nr:transcriptional regulator, LytTR family-like protein [Ramlibacter tataouinensis TTB310]
MAVLSVQLSFNSITHWMDLRSVGRPVPFWHPLLLELTSALAIGLLIPAVLAFERRFPLRWDTLRRHLPWHLAATVAFSAAHVLMMMGARRLVFGLLGIAYGPPSWLRAFGYEYLKDVRTYVLILAAVLAWRLLLLRLQGEARVLDAPESPADAPVAAGPAARPERFLVRKLRKEFLIAVADIEWVQAQANYVGLHVNGHDYLLRSTLAEFLQQLDPARFVRVHRSYVVNLDRIAEIEPLDGGDARLRMKDGSQVPCSRRYRAALGTAAAS